MTTRQAAEALGIGQNAVLSAIRLKTLDAYKNADGQWDITEEAVEKYRQEHRGKQGRVSKEAAHARAAKAAATNRQKRGSGASKGLADVEAEVEQRLWQKFEAELAAREGTTTRPSTPAKLTDGLPAPVERPVLEGSKVTVDADDLVNTVANLVRRVEQLEALAWRLQAGVD